MTFQVNRGAEPLQPFCEYCGGNFTPEEFDAKFGLCKKCVEYLFKRNQWSVAERNQIVPEEIEKLPPFVEEEKTETETMWYNAKLKEKRVKNFTYARAVAKTKKQETS